MNPKIETYLTDILKSHPDYLKHFSNGDRVEGSMVDDFMRITDCIDMMDEIDETVFTSNTWSEPGMSPTEDPEVWDDYEASVYDSNYYEAWDLIKEVVKTLKKEN